MAESLATLDCSARMMGCGYNPANTGMDELERGSRVEAGGNQTMRAKNSRGLSHLREGKNPDGQLLSELRC